MITIILVLLGLVLFGLLFKSTDGSIAGGVGKGCGYLLIAGIVIIAIIVFLLICNNM